MALLIHGRQREDIGRADFLALGAAAGLRARAVERALDGLCERVDAWIDDLPRVPFDVALLRKLRRAIEVRRERLRGGDAGPASQSAGPGSRASPAS
jgi:hypothetical protein